MNSSQSDGSIINAVCGCLFEPPADTPLHIACYNGHFEIVRFLLESFPAIDLSLENVFSESILSASCTYGRSVELVSYILKTPGIEINRQGADGHTGLVQDSRVLYLKKKYETSCSLVLPLCSFA